MLRWLPLLLLPFVGFVVTKNCQTPTQTLSDNKKHIDAAPAGMVFVEKKGSKSLGSRDGNGSARSSSKKKPPIVRASAPESREFEETEPTQNPEMVRRDAKEALNEEIMRRPEPSKENQNGAFRDDKKWIDSLSGLSLQNNKAKRVKPECDEFRCPPSDRPYVDVFGVVFETEKPEMEGKLEQGSFVEKTPAFYIK